VSAPVSNIWTPGGGEQDAARISNLGAGLKVNLKEVEGVSSAVSGLSGAIKTLESTLSDFGNKSYTLADKINRHIKSIGDTATQVSGQLTGLSGAVSGLGGVSAKSTAVAAVPSSPPTTTSSSGGGGWARQGASAISQTISRITSAGSESKLTGGLSLGTFVGNGDDFASDLLLAPLRYLRDRVNTNRDTAMMVSGGLNMQAIQQGVSTSDLMHGMSKFPGSIYGTPSDIMQLIGGAPALGASFGFGGPEGRGGAGQGVRAAGLFKGIREMQMLNPMASVGGQGGLMDTLGGYAADTSAQQKSMMYTGGAMSMIAAGGRQKSLSEWAESILRWFEGLRPGGKRGKGFDYGELMAQYFPGSNIDAWFNANQVPQNMRDYWWTYALGKAKSSPSQLTTDPQQGVTAPKDNVAWERLRSSSELTRTEFGLAGSMSGQYAQRESSNRWFNELVGQMQQDVIPAIGKGPLRMIQYLPDALEDLLMTFAERGMDKLFDGGDVPNVGDVDIGDSRSGGYGQYGGTGLGGLHPDMQSKIGRMMRANPKIRVNSGLRDTGLQKRLKDKGHSNVSGKPSAHTRGMAADLGPRSEYGWIAKNARKFGLASGKNHGEPWHVGMQGDVPGVGDVDIGDFSFDDFMDKIGGVGQSPEGMAGFVTMLLSKIGGGLGKLMGRSDSDAAPFAQNADDLYTRLAGASKNVIIGMSPSGGGGAGGAYIPSAGGASVSQTSKGESVAGTASGWSADGKTWKGTSASGRGTQYNMTADPQILADIQSNDAITRGTAVAKALHNAGFSGEVLKNFMRISYRESHWMTNQWVTDSDDIGGGILGVNQKTWYDKVPKQAAPYTQADVLDPQASAYIAWDMYKNVAPVNGPGGPNTYRPWNGFNGIPQEAGYLSDAALQKAGLGDVEAMQAATSLSTPQRSTAGITFSNTFNLGVGGYGGGSNGGMDARHTAVLIADHLEDEMKKRLQRTA
jgi:hypothetical protein